MPILQNRQPANLICRNDEPSYNVTMSMVQLRREIKKAVDRLPVDRLSSVADYVHFLARPDLATRIAQAEKAIAAGKGINRRKVRRAL
jgi:hypothetical protein